MQRKIARIPQTVSKEQPRHAVAAVTLIHLQNAFGIQLRTHHHVMMQMDTALGRSGATRRVEPERDVILAGQLWDQLRRGSLDQFAKRKMLTAPSENNYLTQEAQAFAW